MIGLIVRHPRIVVILEVDCSAKDGPVPRDHFIQAVRLEGDMMQRGFDDRHCGLQNSGSSKDTEDLPAHLRFASIGSVSVEHSCGGTRSIAIRSIRCCGRQTQDLRCASQYECSTSEMGQ